MLNGELDESMTGAVRNCEQRPEFCWLDLKDKLLTRCANMPDYVNRANEFKLVHDVEDRITAICVTSL